MGDRLPAGRPVLVAALLLSVLSHAGVLTLITAYGNRPSMTNGSGLVTVEVAPLESARPAAPVHSHATARRAPRRPAEAPQPELSDTEASDLPSAPASALAAARTAVSVGEGQVYGEEEVDVPARLRVTPRLAYPEAARRDGIEGEVELFLKVDSQGKVFLAEVARGGGHGFDEAALASARSLQFTPAQREGAPVAVHLHWVCRFAID